MENVLLQIPAAVTKDIQARIVRSITAFLSSIQMQQFVLVMAIVLRQINACVIPNILIVTVAYLQWFIVSDMQKQIIMFALVMVPVLKPINVSVNMDTLELDVKKLHVVEYKARIHQKFVLEKGIAPL
jgi:hypothetical protein